MKVLMVFCLQKLYFWKNLVVESQSKNFYTNQNAGLFKLQYLINELRYESEFLNVIRYP